MSKPLSATESGILIQEWQTLASPAASLELFPAPAGAGIISAGVFAERGGGVIIFP